VGGGGRAVLFDAVDAVLSGIASASPLLLILDDLHWADRPIERASELAAAATASARRLGMVELVGA
jgi:hypothetical protein